VAQASRPALLWLLVAGSGFRTLGELIVVVSNPEHDRLSCWLFHRFAEGAHFLTSLPPMLWIIGQHTLGKSPMKPKAMRLVKLAVDSLSF
jgi:hypothetical protein